MLDILRQHLAENSTSELTAQLEQAFQTFERIGLENYEPGYEEILMTTDNDAVGTKDTLGAVVELTAALLRQILRAHSVTLIEHVPLTMLTDVVNALLDLQNFSDLPTLQATASLDGLPNEVFAELCALVTAHPVAELMVYLEEVDWHLPRRLRDLASRELTPEQAGEYGQHVAKHRELLLGAIQADALPTQLDFTEAVRQGMPLGLPFATYMQRFGWQLAQWDVERSGQELLAMALASRDGYSNPRGMIAEHIEKFIPGLDRVTAIDVDVTNRLMKINHEQA